MKTSLLIFLFPWLAFSQPVAFPSVPGWTVTQEEPVYTPDNLWDAIDGAADLYLEYGFVDLRQARYLSSDSIEIRVEIYRHNTSVNAYGMYAQERDPSYHFIPLGAQGYLQEGALSFLDGPFYVKLSSITAGPRVQAGLRAIGMRLESSLGQPNELPPLFQMFPGDGRVPNASQYIAKNFLGYSFLNGAYLQPYNTPVPLKSFVIPAGSPEGVDSLLAAWKAAIGPGKVSIPAKGMLVVRDPGSGTITLLKKGSFLAGVMGDVGTADAQALLARIAGNLPPQ